MRININTKKIIQKSAILIGAALWIKQNRAGSKRKHYKKTDNSVESKTVIAGLFHDIRTPLSAIKAYSEGYLDGVANTPEMQKRYMSIIYEKSLYLDRLIDRLFLVIKLDSGEFPFQMERLDLGNEITKFFVGTLDELKDKGVILEWAPPEQKCFINADPILLTQIFSNISENSIRYRVRDQVKITVSLGKLGTHASIVIKDNGEGVADKDLERIFEVFYRGTPKIMASAKGSGLGLSVTRKIVHSFGGNICAKNFSDGFGIIINLPLLIE